MSCLLYSMNNKYIIMPKKSKIDIFNVMTEEELDDELNNSKNSRREYQRIVAMKFISLGLPHNLVAEGLGVHYRTINRWAHACNEGGLANLKPNFSGGRQSKMSINEKLEFGNYLFLNEGLTLSQARQYLIDNFKLEYSLTHVKNIITELGFKYHSARPEFEESPVDKEKILTDRIKEANITKDDIVISLDESTFKTGIKTKKGIYLDLPDKKNDKK